MFSFPSSVVPLSVESMARRTFRVTFCTKGLSGSGVSLISMLVKSPGSRLFAIIGPMRLSIILISSLVSF